MSHVTPAGLLVMAYGTPRERGDVEAYYTHIRRGRPPTPEQLADLVRRYDAIGGVSPLAARTADQVAGIAAGLEATEPGRWRVVLGNKHATPFVEDAVGQLVDAGARSTVGLVLAPHFSRGSVAEYHARAAAVAGDRGVSYAGVETWADEPAWLDAQAERVRAALAGLPAATHVLFTAHSLPERVLAGDPYPDQLAASAAAIAARVGLGDGAPDIEDRRPGGWSLGWQSAGRTPEPWRGPDVLDVLRELGTTDGVEGVLVCPQGFVSDHLEVLYDLDVDARVLAGELGLAFARTASINAEPAVMAALADRVRRLPVPTP
ncbi:MAG TPA: ferrochelatase [Acidimicrobiales bacterium]|nr:ferrochelatase [Acidimicrobiales bacterium]